MNIHEFQAKQILGRFGAPVPKGQAASTPDEAASAFKALGQPKVVVKAQIHAGGRGKAGGVKLLSSADEVRDFAAKLLGKPLVTHQTGPEGRVVRRVYIEEASQVARELYLGMLVDRKAGCVSVIASTEGGMDIEEVAAKTPEKILTEPINPLLGVSGFLARKIAFSLGLKDKQIGQFTALLSALYKAFIETDASLIEINPLVVTADGRVICLDAKMSFDDNGLFRHPDIRELRDANEEDPAETEAAKFDLSYVHLDGNIGCMVNGAGLAMATMDIVKIYGAEPANFLDVGGGASTEKVAAAFRILLSDTRVKGVLINIFGGIMRCDVLAQGVVEAAKQVKLSVPLVVRMEGTNVTEGKKILADSGIKVITASDMADAARRIVKEIGA
ncbi:MAG: ADP-forming succinate--CoA ligase subunit beta [Candidatus Binatus sp.]|uniref:ADP-forming succinate--CoA ligase subunit beta n=1 Tax=Candidatus Binatus sp. TaxID=2811406 RepID=UPI0027176503|nr:ADP-forming succinate--CoA ligase subunit beta [Candidatus Binatus sp.]MDO8431033.1 ADP-forming succinate--CoA ligase subunit beta [Candidatus Binatus sp.]